MLSIQVGYITCQKPYVAETQSLHLDISIHAVLLQCFGLYLAVGKVFRGAEQTAFGMLDIPNQKELLSSK
jgi:hypothetical protein